MSCGLGQRSQYSDSLRAGWSRDQIPVGARLSTPVQIGQRAHTASHAVSYSQGAATTIHPLLAPQLNKEYSYNSIPPLGLQGLF